MVVDAGLTASVFQASFSRDLILEGFVITRGVNGILIQTSTNITIRNNRITGHNNTGINIRVNSTGVVITANLLADNDRQGLQVAGGSEATVTQNTLRQNGRQGCSSLRRRAPRLRAISSKAMSTGWDRQNSSATVTHNTARQNGEMVSHRAGPPPC